MSSDLGLYWALPEFSVFWCYTRLLVFFRPFSQHSSYLSSSLTAELGFSSFRVKWGMSQRQEGMEEREREGAGRGMAESRQRSATSGLSVLFQGPWDGWRQPVCGLALSCFQSKLTASILLLSHKSRDQEICSTLNAFCTSRKFANLTSFVKKAHIGNEKEMLFMSNSGLEWHMWNPSPNQAALCHNIRR